MAINMITVIINMITVIIVWLLYIMSGVEPLIQSWKLETKYIPWDKSDINNTPLLCVPLIKHTRTCFASLIGQIII